MILGSYGISRNVFCAKSARECRLVNDAAFPPSDAEMGSFDQKLEKFRPLLRLLARTVIGVRFRPRLDPSDVVQQTLIEAYCNREQFRGETDDDLAEWLKQILRNNAIDQIRACKREKRNVNREMSLDFELAESWGRLDVFAANLTSPSNRAEKNEQLLLLAEQLERLPLAQREAIEGYYLRGWTYAEVGKHIHKTGPAAAGLVFRGLKKLRSQLVDGLDRDSESDRKQ